MGENRGGGDRAGGGVGARSRHRPGAPRRPAFALAPKLWAKPASIVVDLLLAEDSVSSPESSRKASMTDRSARRLFERLITLGGVLDGLLNHLSGVHIEEHYTDTGGARDHVFGLCHLFGFRFAPGFGI